MRKLAIVIGIVAGVVLVAAGIAWALIDVNSYRGTIQSQIERQLNREVTLGKMNLHIFPLQFQVENPVIGEDAGFGKKDPFIQADKLGVFIRLMPLLRGNVQIDSVDLQRPHVELIKNKQGVWNFSSLGKGESAPSENPSSGSSRQLSLSRLVISDGQVGMTDLQKGQPRAVYDHIDVSLLDYAAGKPFSFDVAVHFPGKGSQELRFKGKGGPIPDNDPATTPFEGILSLKEVGIGGLKSFLATDTLAKAEGSLSGQSQIRSQSGKLAASGNTTVDGGRINSVDIGYPIKLDYDLTSDSAGLLQITAATIKLGTTPLSLNGSVNTAATPVQLNLDIKSADVSIAEVARLAAAFGVAFAPGTDVKGRFSGNVKVRGSAANPALTGTVNGRDLEISGKNVPQPVEVKAVNLSLSPNEISSNEFDVRSGKTTLNTRFALKQYNSKSPSADVSVRAPSATLPEVQAITKAYGFTGLDQIAGQGNLSLDLHAAGPLASIGSSQIIKALNGNLNLNFDAVRFSGFDMTHELASIGGFLKPGESGKGFTDIIRLAGHIAMKNGMAQTNDLQVLFDIGNLAATGTADLASNALNLRVSSVLSKAFSDKVGATRAGSYMSTALSNDRGELVIPAIVTGALDKPKFAPDLQAVVRMQRQKLLPSLDNPAAAFSDLFRSVTEKKEPSAEPQAPTKPANSIKSILGGLFKKKPPKQPN